MALRLWQSNDIHEYKPILEGLVEDFDYIYYHAILAWCDIIKGKDNKFWQVWLISFDAETIGFCGLYSLYENRTNELWLAWFGILPSWRNKGIGTQVLEKLEENARKVGCTKLCSYVDEDGKPLRFYQRNGFRVIGKVREFLAAKADRDIGTDDFQNENDWIIEKSIGEIK
jgi:GNAT superfamily N-acetyltransferase